jgi:hypothetical protein
MKKIISPVDRDLLISELTPDKLIRKTNLGNNELYIVSHHNAPNVILEIGRLREVTFRDAGGGTGKEADIDKYDTADNPYLQLLVWDPEEKEILGGYRFFICEKTNREKLNLATHGLFSFSDTFINTYLPDTIELGRSFVQPDYQSTNKFRKALYALDNLWDGLGALVVDYPLKKYFFGKMTIYQEYDIRARDLLYYYMERYFPDNEKLVWPNETVEIQTNRNELASILNGNTFEENQKKLSQHIRSLGEMVPPLVNAYLSLSRTAKTFGSSINPYFGNVIETGLLVTIQDIYPEKAERYIGPYKMEKNIKG